MSHDQTQKRGINLTAACDTTKSEDLDYEAKIGELDKKIEESIKDIEKKRERRCFVLRSRISPSYVDKVYTELREDYSNTEGKLDVIVNSPGGDIDAAYNIACLFQRYGNNNLTFIIPRWAKSAATLIVCAGEEILMTPVAELGPLDPQITQINKIEERVEQFSPLHVSTTLEMIRNEYSNGNKDLADGLLKRLQFPLTLGSFVKAHEISEQYLTMLLKERMGKTGKLGKDPSEIAKCLSRDYADHGFCINLKEAKRIGLNISELDGDLLDIAWGLHTLYIQRDELERKKHKESLAKLVEKLPQEILDKLKNKSTSDNGIGEEADG